MVWFVGGVCIGGVVGGGAVCSGGVVGGGGRDVSVVVMWFEVIVVPPMVVVELWQLRRSIYTCQSFSQFISVVAK